MLNKLISDCPLKYGLIVWDEQGILKTTNCLIYLWITNVLQYILYLFNIYLFVYLNLFFTAFE